MSVETSTRATIMTFSATDGVTLTGTLIEPYESSGRVLIINSAMGVKRGYYQKFAQYAAERGFTTLIYDYRGIGDSSPAKLRGYQASLWDWAVKDAGGALNWALERYPSHKIMIGGHSVGGQIIGLEENSPRITAALHVAAQSGYWKNWDGVLQLRMLLLWYVMIPGLTGAFGYMPSKLLGLGEPLPAGVAQDWARAGRLKHYIVDLYGSSHFERFSAPILSYSLSDDDYAPHRSVEKLLTYFPNAPKTHKHVAPADLGVKAIGHFGFFRSQFAPTLWKDSLNWLVSQS